MARAILFYSTLCAMPALAFAGLDRFIHWLSSAHRLTLRPTPEPPPRAYGPPLQRLASDLRRLEGEYVRVEQSNQPAKAFRLQAVCLAYDDTLVDACRALELPEPERPLSALDRVQAQAELARAGLTW